MANLKDITNRVAAKLGVSRRVAKVVADELIDQIKESLVREEPVLIVGFGRWYHTYQELGGDPEYFKKRGLLEGLQDPRLRVCRFKFEKGLRERLNGFDENYGVKTSDPRKKLDYKERERVSRIREMRLAGETEFERRAKAGIDLDEICRRMEQTMTQGSDE